MTDVRTTKRGTIGANLLRDFITYALRHDAVADNSFELLHAHVHAGDDADPAVVATGLLEMLSSTLEAATPEDWQAVGDQLIQDVRAIVDERGPATDR
jgi:hypothetical protein